MVPEKSLGGEELGAVRTPVLLRCEAVVVELIVKLIAINHKFKFKSKN